MDKNFNPFDWQRSNAVETDTSNKRPSRRDANRPMTARARTEKVLAHRWGNPYCKPGAP